jgi:CRISPR system Cascade subunit CasB
MARLRHAAGQPTGTVADVWDDTIGLVPQRALGHGDDPSPFEQAVHHTMIMFALHRQGRIMTAHVPDVSLGKALRRLSRSRSSDGEDSGAVRRRFDALLTASSPDEGAYHLRGLVRLLRSEDVALDYGRLATDLVDLWTSGRSDRVRLQWARDYRRSERPSEEPTSAAEGTPDP